LNINNLQQKTTTPSMKTTLTYLFFVFFFFSNAQSKKEKATKSIDSINLILDNQILTSTEKLNNLGKLINLHLVNNDLEKLTRINNEVQALALKEKDTFHLALSNKGNAIINILNGNFNKGIIYLKKTITLLKSINNHPSKRMQIQNTYLVLAQNYAEINNYGDASNYVLKSLNYLPKNNDSLANYNKIDAYNLLGFINSEIENNSIAIQNLKKALVLENEMNDEYGKCNTYNLIGIIHSKQNNEVKALEYYELALSISKKNKDIGTNATLYNNIGISYYQLKDYIKSREMLLKSIQMAKETHNDGVLADSHLYLGKSFIAENKIDLGLININKSMSYAKNNSQSIMIDNLLVKSEVAQKHTNTSQAISYLNEALLLLDKTETIEIKKRVYKSLSNIYTTIDIKKAEFYSSKYQEIKDSIISLQQYNKTEVLKAEFDYIKIQADLKSKEADLLLSQEKEKATKNRNAFIFTLATLLIIFLTVTILRQNKLSNTRKKMWANKKDLMAAKQENLDKEIEYKNQQITDFAIHISEKNELLEHIKQKVKKLPIINKTTASQINDVIVFINDDISQNKEKVQLYSEIDETTNSFNHNLSNLYPELTEKERRIATLVRLSHTSKQISLQLNITPASVDNYRSILRKKMNVTKGVALSKFIKNI